MSTDGTTWVTATSTPTSASNTITVRSPHTVSVTANVDADQLTVDVGGQIAVNSGVTFTIADGTGTDLTANGLVVTASQLANNGQTQINGTLQIDSGGFINGNAPTYGPSSLLKYNTGGTYGRGTEWSATSGAGYPNNVQLSSNTTLNMGANGGTGTARQMAGSLTIDSGSTFQMAGGNPMSQPVTVLGSITNNGLLALSTSIGGDIKVGGDWTKGASGTFAPNNRAVFFIGTGTQSIAAVNDETFNYLIVDKPSGNLTIGLTTPTVYVTATAGDVLQLLNAGGIDLNTRTLSMQGGNGGNIKVSGGVRTISGATGSVFDVANSKTVMSASGGTLVFANGTNVILRNALDFGPSLSTVNGTLTINNGGSVNTNPPTYGSNSKLVYNCGCTYGRGAEWSATSGPGYPATVQVSGGTTLDLGNGGPGTARQISGALVIDPSSQLSMAVTPMTASLTVLNDVTNNGTLTLSTQPGGDLHINDGNFVSNGTFNANNRALFFEGSQTRGIASSSGSLVIPYLRINKTGGTIQLVGTDVTTLGPNGGDSIQFTGTTSTLTLNGRTLTLGSTIGATSAGSGFIGSTTSNMSLQDGGTAGAMGTLTFVSGGETLNNLTLDRSGASGSVSLGSDLTVAGTLTLTNGVLDDRTNNKLLSVTNTAAGAVSRTNGYVDGTLRRSVTTGSSYNYPLGSFGYPSPVNNGYTPFDLNTVIATGTATFTAKVVPGSVLPGLSGPNALRRYWTLTNGVGGTGGITSAVLQFTWLAADVNGTEALYQIAKNTDGAPPVTFIPSTINPVTHMGTTDAPQTVFSDWSVAQIDAPTAVKMVSFNATSDKDGVLIRWQTGREVDNLGFNLVREDGRGRSRVTPSLVAGSALMAGPRTTLTAGQSYSWWDAQGRPDSRYYLEDVDLNGQRSVHGPISPGVGRIRRSGGTDRQATLLSELRPLKGATVPASEQGRPATLNEQTQGSATDRQSISADSNSLDKQRAIAAGQAVKLQIRQDGWYRVTQPELVAAGLNPAVEPGLLQLYADGIEQPILTRSSNDKTLGTDGAIEFYGTGLDTPGSATRTYWLVAGTQPGKRIEAKKGTFASELGNKVDAPNGLGIAQSFAYTVERRDRVVYFAGLHNGDAENFFGPIISNTAATQTLTVSQLNRQAATAATLELSLQGGTMQAHQVRIKINGTDLGVVNFNNQEHPLHTLSVPQTALVEGQNTVTLTSEGGETDVSVVDYVRLTYAHNYTADANALVFSMAGRRGVTVNGFTSPNVSVYDITEPNDVRAIRVRVEPQINGYAVSVPTTGRGERTLLALTDERAQAVAGATANQPSSWTGDSQPGTDLVIITHSDFRNAVEPLAQLRRNQGLQVAVVDVEDVYDEFSYGAHSSTAVSDFLSWTATHWPTAPRYVLLVGDASLDPRNYLGYGLLDFVPTRTVDTSYLETASDDALADFDSDGLAEMAVGRLPVRTIPQAQTVVGKITGYVPGVSAQGALLISDHNDGYDFEAVNQQVQSQLPPGMPVTIINRGDNPPDQVRGQIIGSINEGPQVVNYVGHGSVEVWAGAGLLSSADAHALTNGNRLPLFISMTCLNGYFHDLYTESLAEALVKAEQGGAVASWASSGLTPPGSQSAMDEQLMQLLFGKGDSPLLGDAIRAAKTATSDHDVRRTWILFGDPTMRLR